jgi:hypothetical protein
MHLGILLFLVIIILLKYIQLVTHWRVTHIILVKKQNFLSHVRVLCVCVFTPTKFTISYDALKAELQRGDPTIPLGPAQHMMAAAEAGVVTLVLTNPIWVIKTRLCLQCGDGSHYLSEQKRYKYIISCYTIFFLPSKRRYCR